MQYIPMIEKKDAFELFFADMRLRPAVPNLYISSGKLTFLGVLLCISIVISLVRGLFPKVAFVLFFA